MTIKQYCIEYKRQCQKDNDVKPFVFKESHMIQQQINICHDFLNVYLDFQQQKIKVEVKFAGRGTIKKNGENHLFSLSRWNLLKLIFPLTSQIIIARFRPPFVFWHPFIDSKAASVKNVCCHDAHNVNKTMRVRFNKF